MNYKKFVTVVFFGFININLLEAGENVKDESDILLQPKLALELENKSIENGKTDKNNQIEGFAITTAKDKKISDADINKGLTEYKNIIKEYNFLSNQPFEILEGGFVVIDNGL